MEATVEILEGVAAKVGDKISVTQVFEFGLKQHFWGDDDVQEAALEFADELVRRYFELGISVAPVYAESSGEILEVWGVNHQYQLTGVVRVVAVFDLKPIPDASEQEREEAQLALAVPWPWVVAGAIAAVGIMGVLWSGYPYKNAVVRIARAIEALLSNSDTVKTIGVVIAVVALVFLLSKVL